MGHLGLRGCYAMLDVKPGEARDALRPWRARAAALLAGSPACLQLRGKTCASAELLSLAQELLPLCRTAGVRFCVNDRVDVALAVGADFVHVGQDDLPLPVVRQIAASAGAQMSIGVSTHSLAQARAAAEAGADYIGFGPVFATRSKENPDPVVGLEGLRAACTAVSVPVVAIGGITIAAVPDVVAAGASAVAIIGDLERAADVPASVRLIGSAFR